MSIDSITDINSNNKLRCREKHSTSVVLSWCTLWHFSRENLLMANQPLLRIWRNNANYTAITLFKVIQGHQLRYQSKAHMLPPVSD